MLKLNDQTNTFKEAFSYLSEEIAKSEFDWLSDNINFVCERSDERDTTGSEEAFSALAKYIFMAHVKYESALMNPYATAARLMRAHGVSHSGGVFDGGTLFVPLEQN
ncbi:MAG: hypothetical protein EON58_02395 [Alphaproteobacteria bacterium]|nr:MAG: hypothetical protein EON58_02395 [Alphaproteobacteria bacterium]